MVPQATPVRFGPFGLVRRCADHPLAERWVGLHDRDLNNALLYRFRAGRDSVERRDLLAALESLAALRHAHIQTIESIGMDDHERLWVVSPYPGNHVGLVWLADLFERKAAPYSAGEARRVAEQLLAASAAAHDRGLVHGPIFMDRVLVDRAGSLAIELYGMERLLFGGEGVPDPAARRDEVRSIVAIVYRLLTGLPADEPRLPAARLIRRLDRSWDAWFDAGLDPSAGFASAAEAWQAITGSGTATISPPVIARTVRPRAWRWAARGQSEGR